MNDLRAKTRASLKRRKKTQEWLAAELGISTAYLSLILSGQRRCPLTVAIAFEKLTGISIAEVAEAAS